MNLLSLVIALIMYVFMIVMNTLANTMPINNINTGEVSFKYPNLFQPTGLTFSIWGLIYLLLLVYLIFQFANFNNIVSSEHKDLYVLINIVFALSSLFNGLWILAWHYDKILLSTIIMLFLLISLAIITKIIPIGDTLSKTAFSVYFGWITIATIANITIMLVKMGVPNFETSSVIITNVILFVGVIIASLWIYTEKDLIYSLVIIWAYFGIFLRHFSTTELNQTYPSIYISALVAILLIVIIDLLTLYKH
jgi:hypothetical protein